MDYFTNPANEINYYVSPLAKEIDRLSALIIKPHTKERAEIAYSLQCIAEEVRLLEHRQFVAPQSKSVENKIIHFAWQGYVLLAGLIAGATLTWAIIEYLLQH